MSLGLFFTVAGASAAWLATAVLDQSAATAAQIPFRPVAASDLCVTSGNIESLPSGALHVDKPTVRAVMAAPYSRAAELSFTYQGPSRKTVRLLSGLPRRQLGLKLRAQNGCNLVYVMWRLVPEQKLTVQVKRNPGLQRYSECKNSGYRIVRPTKAWPVPTLSPGSSHRLRAMLDGQILRVEVDNQPVWTGELGDEIMAFDGPIGIRTDNVAMDFTLMAGPPDPKSGPPQPMADRCHSVEIMGD